jgi:hypothetical protein
VIEPHIFNVDDIGESLRTAHQSVQQAGVGTNDVRVEHAEDMRYCVRRKVWEWAPRLRQWVTTVRERLVQDQEQVAPLPKALPIPPG